MHVSYHNFCFVNTKKNPNIEMFIWKLKDPSFVYVCVYIHRYVHTSLYNTFYHNVIFYSFKMNIQISKNFFHFCFDRNFFIKH